MNFFCNSLQECRKEIIQIRLFYITLLYCKMSEMLHLEEIILLTVSAMFFFNPHRQQVPERNQKKKKKMKWRAERSTGSHRFHCAILWPPLLPFTINTYTNTHTYIPYKCQGTPQQWSSTGAQKGKGGADTWLDGSRAMQGEVNLKQLPWNECYALSSQFMVPFKGFVLDPSHVRSS